MDWVIIVGSGYGAFLFRGSEVEAEEMRVHKARWERAVAQKRPATEQEVANDEASQCWNHHNFSHAKKGVVYACGCGNCDS